jgi:hypothetical protein
MVILGGQMERVSWVSRIGVIEPGMIGIMRPLRMAPKRDFEGSQECGFLPDFATTFSLPDVSMRARRSSL